MQMFRTETNVEALIKEPEKFRLIEEGRRNVAGEDRYTDGEIIRTCSAATVFGFL